MCPAGGLPSVSEVQSTDTTPKGLIRLPLYMDMHTLDDAVTVEAVAEAHLADLQAQANHDVRYLRYWVDEGDGTIFCLVEAPSPEAAATVHREAHGLVADRIFQVHEGS